MQVSKMRWLVAWHKFWAKINFKEYVPPPVYFELVIGYGVQSSVSEEVGAVHQFGEDSSDNVNAMIGQLW